MLIALSVFVLITFSGTILTYLYEKEDSLLVRVCAGCVVGSALFGLLAFLISCLLGLSVETVLVSLLLALFSALLLIQKQTRAKLIEDFGNAKAKLENTSVQKVAGLLYYAAFFVVLCFFFSRAMIETPAGIFTGGSQNLGDLPFHLGAVFSFTEGNNLPPENPSFAFAKFTYPFMADFITACLVKLGASVSGAMLLQNVFYGFSLVVLFEKFAFALTKNRLAGKLAPVIFLFGGGLGFLLFFRDYWADGRGFFEFIWNLSKDYTIRSENFRWGNPLVVLFMTQRSLLLGMPLTLIVLTKLWEIFNAQAQEGNDAKEEISSAEEDSHDKKLIANHQSPIANYQSPFTTFFVGMIAGTLPLIHTHSLIVLFVITAFLFFLRIDKWREWIAFGLGVAMIAVLELLWAMTGSATNLSKFIEWHFGWDKGERNFFYFWWINLGLFIPLLLISFYFLRLMTKDKGQRTKDEEQKNESRTTNYDLLIFYIPFALLFIISNTFKLAPWEWDNIKVLIYWFVGSVPLVAWLLAWVWERKPILKILAAACFFALIASGAIDVWRVCSKQINYEVFNADAVKIAEQIKQKTSPNALFLNAPTYNSAVVLSGRRSLMRYSGHLSSYGIDYAPRELEVKRIYEGTALASSLLKKEKVEYIIVSPEETSNLTTVNEAFFSNFPIVAESGAYRVYQVK